MDNSRKHQRLRLRLDASIKPRSGKALDCATNDISFGGISVTMANKSDEPEGDLFTIEVFLESCEGLSIVFECRKIHRTGSVYGFNFISVAGLDGYDRFRNLMVHNSPDPDALIEELSKHPGIIRDT